MPKKSFCDSKLFQLLTQLNAQEYNRLGNWLESKWPKVNTTLFKLYQTLRPYYPAFNAESLKRNTVYAALFPSKNFEPNRLSALMSDLLEQVEAFLIHEILEKEENLKVELLAKVYAERNLQDWAKQKARKLTTCLEEKPVKDWETLSKLCLLYEQQHRWPPIKYSKPQESTNLQTADSYLDQFYTLGKYRFLVEFAELEEIRAEVHHVNHKAKHLETIVNWIGTQPVFKLYQAYLSLRKRQGKNKEDMLTEFYYLKDFFLDHYKNISHFDQSILLFLLINKGARAQLSGDTKILRHLLNLYQLGIEKDLLLYFGQLTPNTFANIITLGNSLNEFEFIQKFIADYASKLPNEIQEDATIWAKTHLAFKSKDPTLRDLVKDLREIRQMKSTFAVRTRVLTIQIWFEDFIGEKEDDIRFVLHLCEAFRLQLTRTKLYSPERLAAYRRFVKYTRQLIQLKYNNRIAPSKLRLKKKAISEEEAVQAKDWLYEWMDKLIGE